MRFARRIVVLPLLAWLGGLATPGTAAAQVLPSTPLTLLDGRLVVGGSASASVAPSDDRAYYNLSYYDTSLLRMVQVALDASLRVSDRADVVVAFNGLTPVDDWAWQAYSPAFYLAVRPFAGRSLAIKGGILPPAFGAFLQRRYGTGNFLIGYPLAYQYATSVRDDAFPASADELLRRRGFGAVSTYSRGEVYTEPGLPLVNPFGWNPGVSVTVGGAPLNAEVVLTRGGIANRSIHSGWQVSGRVEARPSASLALGFSAARGSYVNDNAASLTATAAFNPAPRETAFGFDAEYSWGYWLVRGEALLNRRTVPAFNAPFLSDPLWSTWFGAETRYKILPGLYLAGRLERLAFNTVSGSTARQTWDANVTRVEAGGGYSLTRNTTAKLAYQRNSRDTRYYPRQQLVSAQIVVWF